jgi:hypothetical protein
MSQDTSRKPGVGKPYVATKLLIGKDALYAFVEADPRPFLECFRRVGNDEIRCHIVPAYGYDIVVRELLRVPVPAAPSGRSGSPMDHLAKTATLEVFVSGRDDLLETHALEISFEPNALLAAKGAYCMAVSMARGEAEQEGRN